MSTEHLMKLIEVLLWSAAIPCSLFPFVYGFTSKWWLTYMGRSLMATKASLAFALDLTIFFQHQAIGLQTQIYLAIIVYGAIASALWFQLISYLILWRQTRRDAQTEVSRPSEEPIHDETT